MFSGSSAQREPRVNKGLWSSICLRVISVSREMCLLSCPSGGYHLMLHCRWEGVLAAPQCWSSCVHWELQGARESAGSCKLCSELSNLALAAGEKSDMWCTQNVFTPIHSLHQVMDRALLHLDNSYNIPNVSAVGTVCKTNLASNTAFRGFGGPQGMMIAECWMSDLARKCGLPPEEVRIHWHVSGWCCLWTSSENWKQPQKFWNIRTFAWFLLSP